MKTDSIVITTFGKSVNDRTRSKEVCCCPSSPVLFLCCVFAFAVFIHQLAKRHNALLNGLFNKDGRRLQSNRNRRTVERGWLCQYWIDISLVSFSGMRCRLDFVSDLAIRREEERGLLSVAAVGNRA